MKSVQALREGMEGKERGMGGEGRGERGHPRFLAGSTPNYKVKGQSHLVT